MSRAGLITTVIIFPLEGGSHPSPSHNIRPEGSSKTGLPMEPFVKIEERKPHQSVDATTVLFRMGENIFEK